MHLSNAIRNWRITIVFTRAMWSTVVVLLFAGVTAAEAQAAVIRVPADLPSIGSAIAAAQDGDHILVADGVYTGPQNRNLDFSGKTIRLTSENGPDNCIIDCEGQGRAFHFHSGESPSALLEGVTIQNGLILDGDGGGVLCETIGSASRPRHAAGSSVNIAAVWSGQTSPTIRNCIFRWNTVQSVHEDKHGGGALAILASHPSVTDCLFQDNAQTGDGANAGGAVVAAYGARPRFVRCAFRRNRARVGGAVATPEGCQTRFDDCLFIDNSAEFVAGGLNCSLESAARLKGCTFVGNNAQSDAGGLSCWDASTVHLENCEFIGNSSSGDSGGLLCYLGSTAHLDKCRFVGNAAGHVGGGVAIEAQSSATVNNCVFTANATVGESGGGGGMAVGADSSAVVDDSVFSGNSGSGDGGALVLWDNSDLQVNNSTLSGNEAAVLNGTAYGGGICAWGSRLIVSNCVLHGNTAPQGSAFGLMLSPPDSGQEMVITVLSSLVQHGEAGLFFEDQDDPGFIVNWGDENLDADPLFADALGPDGLPWTGDEDLHLLPGSPCIDAGDPAYAGPPGETDVDGDPRVLDGDGDGIAVIDIGADEFVAP
jgi:hypothetical protein